MTAFVVPTREVDDPSGTELVGPVEEEGPELEIVFDQEEEIQLALATALGLDDLEGGGDERGAVGLSCPLAGPSGPPAVPSGPPAVPSRPSVVPSGPPVVSFDAALIRDFQSGWWSSFRITLVKARDVSPFGGYEATCKWHARSRQTKCKKTLILSGDNERDHEVCVRRLAWWCIKATTYSRQRYHRADEVVYACCPPVAWLVANKPPEEVPAGVRNDVDLDYHGVDEAILPPRSWALLAEREDAAQARMAGLMESEVAPVRGRGRGGRGGGGRGGRRRGRGAPVADGAAVAPEIGDHALAPGSSQ